MSALTNFIQTFAGEGLQLIGESSLKVALLLAVAGGASLALRRSPASLRHMVWSLALAGSLAMPMLSGVLPNTAVTLPAIRLSMETLPEGTGSAASRQSAVSNPDAEPGGAGSLPAALPVSSDEGRARSFSWSGIVGLVWLTGFVLLLLRVGLGMDMARRLVARAEPVTDARWLATTGELARSLGIKGPVRLLVHPRITVPLSSGWRSSCILFPPDAADWSSDRLRAVILHELAHLRRHDCQVQTLAQLACALYWFNPLAWVAEWRLRCERERACDDSVLEIGTRPSEYASHLLEIARAPRGFDWSTVATVAMARPGELEGRLLAILDPALKRQATRRGLIGVVAGTVLFTALVATLHPSQGQARPGLEDQVFDEGLAESEEPGSPVPLDAEDDWIVEGSPVGGDETSRPGSGGARPEGRMISGQDPATDDRVTDVFIEALADPDPSVRKEAAFALSHHHSPRATAPLINALMDESASVRHEAAFALGNRGDAEAVPALVVTLNDGQPGVRKEAAFALGLIGDPAGVPGLIAALDDPAPAVRKEAAWALGNIGDERAAGALIAATKDENDQVRREAFQALSHLSPDRPRDDGGSR